MNDHFLERRGKRFNRKCQCAPDASSISGTEANSDEADVFRFRERRATAKICCRVFLERLKTEWATECYHPTLDLEMATARALSD
jgi:hypothetical protein